MKVSLPGDRRREIDELVRREYGITGGKLTRARRISVLTGSLGLGIAVAFGYCLGRIWHGGVAFAYFVSGIAPAIVAVTSHSLLRRLVAAWAIPGWQGYVSEKARRIKQERDSYRNSLLQSSEYWQGLNELGFKCEFARLLQRQGYRTEITDASSDTGVDIVACDESGSVAVRCGHDNEPVLSSVARELYGTIVAGGYASGILVTTDGVSSGVVDFIRDKPIRVIDLPELIRMQIKLDTQQDREQGFRPGAGNEPRSGAQERT